MEPFLSDVTRNDGDSPSLGLFGPWHSPGFIMMALAMLLSLLAVCICVPGAFVHRGSSLSAFLAHHVMPKFTPSCLISGQPYTKKELLLLVISPALLLLLMLSFPLLIYVVVGGRMEWVLPALQADPQSRNQLIAACIIAFFSWLLIAGGFVAADITFDPTSRKRRRSKRPYRSNLRNSATGTASPDTATATAPSGISPANHRPNSGSNTAAPQPPAPAQYVPADFVRAEAAETRNFIGCLIDRFLRFGSQFSRSNPRNAAATVVIQTPCPTVTAVSDEPLRSVCVQSMPSSSDVPETPAPAELSTSSEEQQRPSKGGRAGRGDKKNHDNRGKGRKGKHRKGNRHHGDSKGHGRPRRQASGRRGGASRAETDTQHAAAGIFAAFSEMYARGNAKHNDSQPGNASTPAGQRGPAAQDPNTHPQRPAPGLIVNSDAGGFFTCPKRQPYAGGAKLAQSALRHMISEVGACAGSYNILNHDGTGLRCWIRAILVAIIGSSLALDIILDYAVRLAQEAERDIIASAGNNPDRRNTMAQRMFGFGFAELQRITRLLSGSASGPRAHDGGWAEQMFIVNVIFGARVKIVTLGRDTARSDPDVSIRVDTPKKKNKGGKRKKSKVDKPGPPVRVYGTTTDDQPAHTIYIAFDGGHYWGFGDLRPASDQPAGTFVISNPVGLATPSFEEAQARLRSIITAVTGAAARSASYLDEAELRDNPLGGVASHVNIPPPATGPPTDPAAALPAAAPAPNGAPAASPPLHAPANSQHAVVDLVRSQAGESAGDDDGDDSWPECHSDGGSSSVTDGSVSGTDSDSDASSYCPPPRARAAAVAAPPAGARSTGAAVRIAPATPAAGRVGAASYAEVARGTANAGAAPSRATADAEIRASAVGAGIDLTAPRTTRSAASRQPAPALPTVAGQPPAAAAQLAQ